MHNDLDIVICSIPRMSIYYPPAAPAILKACVEEKGFTCKTIDFVIRLHQKFFNKPIWAKIDNWLILSDLHDPEILDIMKEEITEWAKEISNLNPKWLGISVFSYESHKITRLFCSIMKRVNPNIKIVLGGMGVTDDANNFAPNLKNLGIINEYIRGDAEESLIQLLSNEVIDMSQLENLNKYPFPNWSDYDLDLYKYQKSAQNKRTTNQKDIWQGYGNEWYRTDEILTLPIVGSRGCVRSCSFCDVPKLWPKYKNRDAQNIADEIIQNYEKYNVQRFHFSDSLINGNMKNFRDLCKILAEYRTKHNADFTITGQYIIRSYNRETDEDYAIMAAAGFSILEVGVESGSESVRFHMGKKYTNHDIDIFIDRVYRYGMKALFLIIVGYPTETEKDFQDTLDMLTRYKRYRDNGTLIEACLGGTLRVEPQSELAKDPMLHFIPMNNQTNDDLLWIYDGNPDLNLKERIRRRLILMEHAQKLNYLSPSNDQEILLLRSKWQTLKEYDSIVVSNA